jgi:hypothetical protein
VSDPHRDPDPLVKGTDPRIRTKMIQIRNTAEISHLSTFIYKVEKALPVPIKIKKFQAAKKFQEVNFDLQLKEHIIVPICTNFYDSMKYSVQEVNTVKGIDRPFGGGGGGVEIIIIRSLLLNWRLGYFFNLI